MPARTLDAHIEATPGVVGGKPRIAGRCIAVQDTVIWHDRLGRGADEIAAEYDLTPADTHAALAYYFDHRAEVDATMKQSTAFVAALRRCPPPKCRRKLRRWLANGARHGDLRGRTTHSFSGTMVVRSQDASCRWAANMEGDT